MLPSNSMLRLTIGILLPFTMSFRGPSVPAHRVPKSNAKTLYLQNGTDLRKCSDVITLAKKLPGSKVYERNSICYWDLGGGILNGSKQRGNGGQGENQEPLFRAKTSLIVQNGFVLNNKNGAGFYRPNSGVKNMTWLNVGEDAVFTSRGPKIF